MSTRAVGVACGRDRHALAGERPCGWASGRSSAFPASVKRTAGRPAGPGGGPGPRPRRAAAVPDRQPAVARARAARWTRRRSPSSAGRPTCRHTSPPDLVFDEIRTRDLEVDGAAGPRPARLYEPEAAGAPGPLLVFFHGGGFALGSLTTADPLCRLVAAQAQLRVLSVSYRLAPEHPYPAGLDDALAAFDWVRAHAAEIGADPHLVAVGGDSAGGNLALVTAHERPGEAAFVLALYPVTDVERTGGSRDTFGSGYGLIGGHGGVAGAVLPARRRPGRRPARGDRAGGRPVRDATGLPGHRRVRPAARRGRGAGRAAAAGPACRSPGAGSPGSCTATPASRRSVRRPGTRRWTPRARCGQGSRSPGGCPRRRPLSHRARARPIDPARPGEERAGVAATRSGRGYPVTDPTEGRWVEVADGVLARRHPELDLNRRPGRGRPARLVVDTRSTTGGRRAHRGRPRRHPASAGRGGHPRALRPLLRQRRVPAVPGLRPPDRRDDPRRDRGRPAGRCRRPNCRVRRIATSAVAVGGRRRPRPDTLVDESARPRRRGP